MIASSSRLEDRIAVAFAQRARRLVDVESLLLVRSVRAPAPSPGPVRCAKHADLERLLDLTGAGRRRLQHWRSRRRLAASIDRGDVCLVVDEGAAIVGCIWLTRQPFRLPRYRIRVRPAPGQTYVHGLRVRRDRRGSGYGERLLLAAIEQAGRRGSGEVIAHISPRNPATPHLVLEKLGYEVVERVRVLLVFGRFGLPLPLPPGTRRRG